MHSKTIFVFLVVSATLTLTAAQTKGSCPRPDVGSVIQHPPAVEASGGSAVVRLSYQTEVVGELTRYCYRKGMSEAPTIRVRPGDQIIVTLVNGPDVGNTTEVACEKFSHPDTTATNIHFHGIHAQPKCRSDETGVTTINQGESFTYAFRVPTSQPPGLFWYHAHVHPMAEAQLHGGASGAIIVEGIEDVQPLVRNLAEVVLVLRGQELPSKNLNESDKNQPSWDASVNFVVVPYPNYTPAVLRIVPGEKQFWRVINAAANSHYELQVVYDGKVQPLTLISLDGIPVKSPGPKSSILILPGGRAEFIVTGPASNVTVAMLHTLRVYVGEEDINPPRPLLRLVPDVKAVAPRKLIWPRTNESQSARKSDLTADSVYSKQPTRTRRFKFHQEDYTTEQQESSTNFFITEIGAQPKVFERDISPAVIVTQGAVEDWVIENHSPEWHDFHIHQLHFLLLEMNRVPVAEKDRVLLDTVHVEGWSEKESDPYPSVKIRMDFSGDIVGDFMYHCHIIEHEDKGMMQKIRVLPAPPVPKSTEATGSKLTNAGAGVIGGALALIILAFVGGAVFVGYRYYKGGSKSKPDESKLEMTKSNEPIEDV